MNTPNTPQHITPSAQPSLEGMWGSKEKPIALTRSVDATLEEYTARLAEFEAGTFPAELNTPEAQARALATVRKVIAQAERVRQVRSTDPAFSVTVKHVGSPEDPTRWEEIAAQYTEADHLCLVAARRKLLEEFGTPAEATEILGGTFRQAVETRAHALPERRAAFRALVRARLEHGLVGGAAEADRLWNLGGWKLQLEAHAEVAAFQEVTPELGEG